MTKLSELADRVSALEGPCREMDADIALAVHGGEIVWKQANGTMETYPTRRYASAAHVSGFGNAPVEAVTASLDAALSLKPAEHTIQLSDWDAAILREKGPWQAIVLPIGARGKLAELAFANRCDHAWSPALALTAASLRARDGGEG